MGEGSLDGPLFFDKTTGSFQEGTDGNTYFVAPAGFNPYKLSSVDGRDLTVCNVIYGTERDDVLTGTAKGDLIYGGPKDGALEDGTADDSIRAGAGADTVRAGDGNDRLLGEAGDDQLFGGAGDDRIEGGDGNDLLQGDAGNDTLAGGAGADTLAGGTGTDIADYSSSDAPVNINLATGMHGGGAATGDTFSGIDGAIGTSGDDTLIGFDAQGTDARDIYSNVFYGGAGNDRIEGRGGNDSLYAGDGDDTVYGDRAGSAFGGRDDDLIRGGAGNDAVFGGVGADTIYGGTGDDTVYGDVGADLLYGGDGSNRIVFGRGDRASAGTGNDVFRLDDGLDNTADSPDAVITIDGGAQDTTGGALGDRLDLGTAKGWRNTVTDPAAGAGHVVLSDGTRIDYTNIEQVMCFTPGAMIRTLGGARAIETLKVGDMVLTRDSGLQPIRWIGTSTVRGTGAFAPIRLRKGAVPELTGDLVVSPQHRMLIEGYRAELLFGEREVLASAKHMVDGKHVTIEEMAEVTYIHMLFDRHEVVFANGAATESYHPASYGLGGIAEQAREELFAIFPELRALPEAYGDTARRVLKGYEVNALAW